LGFPRPVEIPNSLPLADLFLSIGLSGTPVASCSRTTALISETRFRFSSPLCFGPGSARFFECHRPISRAPIPPS